MVGRIQNEIRQRKPFATETQEAAVALMRTTDLVRSRVAAVIEPFGITLQQYNVLRILRGAGDEGTPTLDIADRMVERTPGITRLLDRLEAKKLVRRRRCPEDKRQILCWITPDGLHVLFKLDRPVLDATEAIFAGLSPDEVRVLIRLLDGIRAAKAGPSVDSTSGPQGGTQS